MALVRAVLDTNVLVSGLAYPASIPGKILAAWHQGRIDVVLYGSGLAASEEEHFISCGSRRSI